jgi:hypothetical protein
MQQQCTLCWGLFTRRDDQRNDRCYECRSANVCRDDLQLFVGLYGQRSAGSLQLSCSASATMMPSGPRT